MGRTVLLSILNHTEQGDLSTPYSFLMVKMFLQRVIDGKKRTFGIDSIHYRGVFLSEFYYNNSKSHA